MIGLIIDWPQKAQKTQKDFRERKNHELTRIKYREKI